MFKDSEGNRFVLSADGKYFLVFTAGRTRSPDERVATGGGREPWDHRRNGAEAMVEHYRAVSACQRTAASGPRRRDTGRPRRIASPQGPALPGCLG